MGSQEEIWRGGIKQRYGRTREGRERRVEGGRDLEVPRMGRIRKKETRGSGRMSRLYPRFLSMFGTTTELPV